MEHANIGTGHVTYRGCVRSFDAHLFAKRHATERDVSDSFRAVHVWASPGAALCSSGVGENLAKQQDHTGMKSPWRKIQHKTQKQ